MKKLKQIIMLMMISIMAIGLVGCSKPTAESLKEDIENYNYAKISKQYNKLEDEEKEKLKELLIKSYQSNLEEYTNGERTENIKNTTIKRMEEFAKIPNEEYKLMGERSINAINELHESTLALRAGDEAMKNKDYKQALVKYNKVSDEDVINKEKADKKIKEINDMNKVEIKAGSKINEGGFDITFNKFEFSYDVLPQNIDGFYSHYQADKGKVYYHVSMDLKNNNKQNIPGDELLEAELVYDKDYKYDGFIALDSSDRSTFDYANITSITPLETRGVRILFDIPQEIETSDKSLEINIKIDGKTYSYKAR